MRVSEAFQEALNARSRAGEDELAAKHGHIKRFLAWLENYDPTITHWTQLSREIWVKYSADVSTRCKTHGGFKKAFGPLRTASSYMADTYETLYTDQLKKANIRTPEQDDSEPMALEEVTALFAVLEWFKIHEQLLYVPAAIRGLAGSRGLEAFTLRICDVNLQKPSLTFTTRVKNAQSRRTIPICHQLALILSEHMSNVDMTDRQAPLLYTATGLPWNKSRSSEAICIAMKRLRDTRLVPEDFDFYHLRATFDTLCQDAAPEMRNVRIRYVGRKAEGITAKHYERILFRDHVKLVCKWETYLEENRNSATAENK